jgi:heptosyltransferase I
MAQRVLIVQLGDLRALLATLPVVADLHRSWGALHVDWVIEHDFEALMRLAQGSTRAIGFPFAQWRAALGSADAKSVLAEFETRINEWPEPGLTHPGYDAVLVCDDALQSSLLAAHAPLSSDGKRFVLARDNAPTSGWLNKLKRGVGAGLQRALTHAVADARISVGQGEPTAVFRAFAERALGHTQPEGMFYGLLAPHQKKRATLKTLALVLPDTPKPSAAWDEQRWQALAKKMRGLGYRIVMPHTAEDQRIATKFLARKLGEGVAAWPEMPLALMPEALAGCWGAIGFESAALDLLRAVDVPVALIDGADSVDAVFAKWLAVAA